MGEVEIQRDCDTKDKVILLYSLTFYTFEGSFPYVIDLGKLLE